jgi:hypothetical protein
VDRPDEAVRPDLGPCLRPIDLIGSGGMGTVWTAHHAVLDRVVAVKVMSAGAGESARARTRFMREAKTASLVKGPHVVEVLEVGTSEDGVPFIVMELLAGRDFSAYLEEHGCLPMGDVVRVISQLASALSSAHALGVVHRDVKPSNVFMCDGHDGLFVKLLDFGIAKDVSTIRGETTTGVIGTPHYMSPEQLIGGETDYRADIWALGVVAFRALTGARPFERETLGALALAIHTAPLPHPSSFNQALPLEVDEWFFRACARDPKRRFDSALDAAVALENAVSAPLRPRATVARAASVGGFVRSRGVDRTLTVGAEDLPQGSGARSGGGRGRSTRALRVLLFAAALAAAGVALAGAVTRGRTGWARARATESLVAQAGPAARPGEAADRPSDAFSGTSSGTSSGTLSGTPSVPPRTDVVLIDVRPSGAHELEQAREAGDEGSSRPAASARPAAPASPTLHRRPTPAPRAVRASARVMDDELPDDRH